MNSSHDLSQEVYSTTKDRLSGEYIEGEVILPIMISLGYDNRPVFSTDVGEITKSRVTTTSINRNPCLILEVLNKTVWIITICSKADESSIDSYVSNNIQALTNNFQTNYCAVITGTLRLFAYKVNEFNLPIKIHQSLLPKANSSFLKEDSFTELFSPSNSYLRELPFEDVYSLYVRGSWTTRTLCMNYMEENYTSDARLIKFLPKWENSLNIRERSLPAVCLLNMPDFSERILSRTLSDPHDAVRDTLYTIVRAEATQNPNYCLPFNLEDCVPDGWFSRVLYCQMLSALNLRYRNLTGRQRETLRRQIKLLKGDYNSHVRFCAYLAEASISSSFPFGVFLDPPTAGKGAIEIHERMIAITLELAFDPEYRTESRQCALDAIQAARQQDTRSLKEANTFLDKHHKSYLDFLLK